MQIKTDMQVNDLDETAREARYQMMGTQAIAPLIFRLALPSIVSMLITSLYNMADTFFVSQLGTSAAGAVGVIFPLMALIQAYGMTFGVGGGSYISRLLGQKDRKRADETASTAVFTVVVMSVITGIGGLLFLKPLVYMLGATETIYPYAASYCGIILFGAPLIATSFVLNKLLQAEGNSFLAMVGISVGVVLNLFLDPIFIFTLDLGVAGAAYATVLSQLVSFVILLAQFVRRRSGLTLKPSLVKLEAPMYGEILKIGMPSFFRQGLTSVSMVILNGIAGPYGDYAIASTSIVLRIAMFGASMLLGFAQGYQPVAGYNYGARKFRRMHEAFLFNGAVTVAMSLVGSVIFFVFARQIITAFRPDDPDVIAMGTLGLQAIALVMPFLAVVFTTNMTFQALGRGFPSAVLALSRQGLCLIPAILILPRRFGIHGVVFAQPAADLVAGIVGIGFTIPLLREIRQGMDGEPPEQGETQAGPSLESQAPTGECPPTEAERNPSPPADTASGGNGSLQPAIGGNEE
jgi:putative MATE family efflux protein